MATQEQTQPKVTMGSMLAWIVTLLLIVTAGTMLAFRLMTGQAPVSLPLALPTAVLALPRPQPQVVAPALPGLAQNAATAQAQYDQAVKAAEQPPNTGQGEPAVLVVKPAERLPAGDNVPTSEPIVQDNSGMFGSKQKPVNPQADHACRHGQVWIEGRGCKNP